jgi:hypothetical protein
MKATESLQRENLLNIAYVADWRGNKTSEHNKRDKKPSKEIKFIVKVPLTKSTDIYEIPISRRSAILVAKHLGLMEFLDPTR